MSLSADECDSAIAAVTAFATRLHRARLLAVLDDRAMRLDARDIDEAMHPSGRCTCGGEGRCEWCVAHPDPTEDLTLEFMPRKAGCLCTWEEGDSPCPVHGEEAES